ncbi:MAG: Hsp33 family molecular chaperone HslO [Desulfuromonas sp.]|nr:MAG: Hsp33 family molecular chaperone HslO [Desulfuromonas sp.]
MSDQMIRVLSHNNQIRASFAVTTDLVKEICQLQGTDPTASVALGRLTTAAALMGSLLKGDQRLGLTIEGNGPLKKLQAETDAYGTVRSTIKNPNSQLPPADGQYNVSGAIGKAGFLHVTKDLGLKEPYHGMVQLVSSEIAEDIAHYFTTSEQTPTSMALGVLLDRTATVAASGGFFIQAMPNCDDEVLETLDNHLCTLPPVSSLIREGLSPLELAQNILNDSAFKLQSTTELSFRCSCNRRHVFTMLTGLPVEDLHALAERDENTEITCEYCKNNYIFTPTEVNNILQARKKP